MLGQLQRLSTQVCVGSASCEEPKRLFTDFLSRGDFPKKSLLAFFLVFLTAAHRVTLSDCLQRPADGLRKSRQHFILIFGEGEIVLFEEETLVEGRCSWADREDNPLARLADSHPPCLRTTSS